ncbi:MAG: class I SAM-dependent methyltransferase [Chloroflexi bacterium]|jgi:cyclopropane-fatty-acyl-phospholipid synthase|nr:class I SAM-dependent methyltransferase [Chloroflexota bacterium]
MATIKTDQITRSLLDDLFGANAHRLSVRLWDGTRWPDDTPRAATIVLNHPGALRAMLLPGTELALGEAYLHNDFDIEGDIESVFDIAESLQQNVASLRARLRLIPRLLRLPAERRQHSTQRGRAELDGQTHGIERDRQAIRYHYDVSNDFYQLWLDSRMVYSCAYFGSPDDDLDTAQTRKLDYICHKLRLQPGQRLLDIGCGWGGLILYAAQHYGVDATGITLSSPQAELANERIAAAGLTERCRALVQDYRELNTSQPYDALVSVGMFEHVGQVLLPVYFRQAWSLLRPEGVFLNHGIANRTIDATRRKLGAASSFSDTYVFPDGELVPISTTAQVAEAAGFEVRDVESLREHYAMTLRHWVRRLEAHHEQALQYVDEPTYRVWRLFMSGSAQGFTVGRLNVYQTLLVKPGNRGTSGQPLTRHVWYNDRAQ